MDGALLAALQAVMPAGGALSTEHALGTVGARCVAGAWTAGA